MFTDFEILLNTKMYNKCDDFNLKIYLTFAVTKKSTFREYNQKPNDSLKFSNNDTIGIRGNRRNSIHIKGRTTFIVI